jgi:transaldolase
MSEQNYTNPVIANAVKHFRDRSESDMKKIEVPEWDTTIYYRDTNSFSDQSKIMQLHQAGKVVEALVETIIAKARKADGTKMFKPAERLFLLNEADPEVLIKIATELNLSSAGSYDLDETAKN